MSATVLWFSELRLSDVDKVGGKNSSLGEMISQLGQAGVSVPNGFATTADAFKTFLLHENLADRIAERLNGLDVDNVNQLIQTGKEIRQWILNAPFPEQLEAEIREHNIELCADNPDLRVAIRSSATAEDLADASFAGQQETFLNINGIENVLLAVKEVFASLYNDRAISYLVHKGYTGIESSNSAGVQRMVRSETAVAGVMFTLDTESGYNGVVFVTSSYSLGETVVQSAVNLDEFYVDKIGLKAGRPAVLRRNLGSKALEMVYTDDFSAGRSVRTQDVDEERRLQFSLTDEEIEFLAKIGR